MRIDIVTASPKDIAPIAARARQSDVQEIYDLLGVNIEAALVMSLERSEIALTGLADGNPELMFGVATDSLLSDTGRPWLIGTDAIDQHPVSFLRRSRRVFEMMESAYPRLENFVSAENTKVIEWLKWLGFEFADLPIPLGIFGKPFYRFWRE